MKDREKEHLYKALVGVLIGFMFTLIAIFTVVAFHFLLHLDWRYQELYVL